MRAGERRGLANARMLPAGPPSFSGGSPSHNDGRDDHHPTERLDPVAAAQGDYLAYLPAGDIYFPYHLEILHQSLDANQRQVGVGICRVETHSPSRIAAGWPEDRPPRIGLDSANYRR